MSPQRYLGWLLGGATVAIVAIVAMGLAVDAFGVFGTRIVPTKTLPPTLRTAVAGDRVTKALEIARRSGDEIVYVGDSRVQFGLDPDSPVFAGRRVYNSASSGASLAEQFITLDYLMAHEPGSVRRIVWGLNLETYSNGVGSGSDFAQSAFAGASPLQGYLRHLLSGAYVAQSLQGIRRWGRHMFAAVKTKGGLLIVSADGTDPGLQIRFTAELEASVIDRRGNPWGGLPEATASLESRLAALKAQGIEVDLAVTPVHVWRLAAYRLTGIEPHLERWKRLLAAMERRLASAPGPGRVRLIDFCAASAETEQPPLHPPPGAMFNFTESSHFFPWLGDRMLRRFMDEPGAPAQTPGFGRELDVDTVDVVIAAGRRDLDAWFAAHPDEVAYIEAAIARAGS